MPAPNHPNRILAHVLEHVLVLIFYCYKEPRYSHGHVLIYMPILSGHVLCCQGLTHRSLAPIVYMIKLLNFILKVFIAGTSPKQAH